MSRRRLAAWLVALAVLGVVLAGLGVRWYAGRTPDLSRFALAIDCAAEEAGVAPTLLWGLVAAESGGDPDARSKAGALGLCQLMPATGREEARRLGLPGDVDLLEPRVNLRVGAAYLGRMLERFGGEETLALAAYNAGPTRVRRWQAAAPGASPAEVLRTQGFSETRAYVERVLRFRDAYGRTWKDARGDLLARLGALAPPEAPGLPAVQHALVAALRPAVCDPTRARQLVAAVLDLVDLKHGDALRADAAAAGRLAAWFESLAALLGLPDRDALLARPRARWVSPPG